VGAPPLSIDAAQGLLAGAANLNGGTLEVVDSTQPAGGGGSVAVQPNGTFVFTPDANALGPVVFTYTLTNGRGQNATATATVNIGARLAAAEGKGWGSKARAEYGCGGYA
jgi:hypothetical protein